jgi:hypothetical protein
MVGADAATPVAKRAQSAIVRNIVLSYQPGRQAL